MNETVNQAIPMIERIGVAPFVLVVLAVLAIATLAIVHVCVKAASKAWDKASDFFGPLVVRVVVAFEGLRTDVANDREMARDTNQKVTAIHRAWVADSEEDEADGPDPTP